MAGSLTSNRLLAFLACAVFAAAVMALGPAVGDVFESIETASVYEPAEGVVQQQAIIMDAADAEALGGLPWPLPRPEDLPEIPATAHDGLAHKDQTWNTDNILPLIASRGCSPIIVWICPARKTITYTCPSAPGDGLWIGERFGWDNPAGQLVRIDGYAARSEYWSRSAARDGCFPAMLP